MEGCWDGSFLLVLVLIRILAPCTLDPSTSSTTPFRSSSISIGSLRYDLLQTVSIEMNTRHHALSASLMFSHLERLAISEPSTAQEEALSLLTKNELTRLESEISVSETNVSPAIRRALNESMAESLQIFIRYFNPDNLKSYHPLNLVQQVADAQSTVRGKESELDDIYESISSDRERVAKLITDIQALLSSILSTWPPIIFSAASTSHTNLLQKLSAFLLKLSLLPLRQHEALLTSHPNLRAAMATYEAAVLRRTVRAQKEADELRGELKKYQTATKKSKGEFERLIRTKAGLDSARAKVESELKELRRVVREH